MCRCRLAACLAAASCPACGSAFCGEVTWGTATLSDLTGVSDGTNTYTVTLAKADAADGQSIAVFYKLNAAACAGTITATFVGNPSSILIMWDEFTGGSASSALRGTGGSQVQASPGTGAIGQNTDLVWGGTIPDTTVSTLTKNAAFTAGVTDNADANFFNLSAGTEWQAVSAAADPTWTIGTNGSMLTAAIAFTLGAAASFDMNSQGCFVCG